MHPDTEKMLIWPLSTPRPRMPLTYMMDNVKPHHHANWLSGSWGGRVRIEKNKSPIEASIKFFANIVFFLIIGLHAFTTYTLRYVINYHSPQHITKETHQNYTRSTMRAFFIFLSSLFLLTSVKDGSKGRICLFLIWLKKGRVSKSVLEICTRFCAK